MQQYFLDVVEICEDAGISWSTISKSRGTIHIDGCSHPDDSKNLHNDSPNTPRVATNKTGIANHRSGHVFVQIFCF